MNTRFEIFPDRSGKWRWRLRAANGRIVADSAQGYSTRTGARRAVYALARHLLDAEDILETAAP